MNHLLMPADLAMMGGTHSQSATAQAKMSTYLAVMMREPLGGMCRRPAAFLATDTLLGVCLIDCANEAKAFCVSR